MGLNFARYHFSATLHTSDGAVLHCLVGLSQWAQRGEKHPQIAWAGCGEKHWRNRSGQATFRFTSSERRAEWYAKAAELLSGKWALISTTDSDPASPPANHYARRQTSYRSGIPQMRKPIVTRSVRPREVGGPVFRRSP
jgi:hypothetical protein